MTVSTTIERTPAEVFAFVADARNDVQWAPLVASVEQVTGDGPGLGAVYRVAQRTGPATVHLDWEVTDFDRPNRLAWAMQTPLFRYRSQMAFTDINGGQATLVTHTNAMTYRIPGAATAWRLGASRVMRAQLANLKRLLESDA